MIGEKVGNKNIKKNFHLEPNLPGQNRHSRHFTEFDLRADVGSGVKIQDEPESVLFLWLFVKGSTCLLVQGGTWANTCR